jgi:hypothetical protein
MFLAPAVARAQDDGEDIGTPPLPPPPPVATVKTAPGIDTVKLRAGATYRGRVTEIIPGDHVTIVVGPNDVKHLPWADVETVVVAPGGEAPPAGTQGASASLPAAAPPMVGPKARVHITTSRSVILYRKYAGSWTKACDSPCDQELPIGDGYRVVGNGVPQSKEFHLEVGPAGFVDIVVDPPNSGGMVFGGILAGTGAFAAWVGSLMALVGAVNAGRDCTTYNPGYYSSPAQCDSEKKDGPGVRDAGLVTMAVGAGVGVLGLVVFFNSATTDIEQKHGGAPKDAFVREPTFRGTSTAMAPGAAFPVLFSHSF